MAQRDFTGKHILITGGSSGIGLSMARCLARAGARLTLIARDEARLVEAQRALEDLGARVAVRSCDVCDASSLREVIDAIAEDGLDGVVANSGYCHPGYFHEIHPLAAQRQVETNLLGVIYTLQAALPHLMQRPGGFVAITSSPAGAAPIFGFSIYGATKAALNSLADTLRHEYRRHNIAVHLLMPPDTDTPGYAHEVTMYPPETRRILKGGRLHDADKVAAELVEGIRKGKRTVVVGWESKMLLWVMRFAPRLWDFYARFVTTNVEMKK